MPRRATRADARPAALALLAFLLGVVVSAALLSPPSFTVAQVSESYSVGAGEIEGAEALASGVIPQGVRSVRGGVGYSTSVAPQTARGVSGAAAYLAALAERRSFALSSTIGLSVLINYGGVFDVNKTYVVDPIVPPGTLGACRPHAINVTIWSPYGVVSRINVTVGPVWFYYKGGALSVGGRSSLVARASASLSSNGGWVYFILNFTPGWGFGGTYDVTVFAADDEHGYSDLKTYAGMVTIINTTKIAGCTIDKTTYTPGETGRITIRVVYNGTDAGVSGERIIINGTAYVITNNGTAVYEFTAPSDPGSYVWIIKAEHGDEVTVSFTVEAPQTRGGQQTTGGGGGGFVLPSEQAAGTTTTNETAAPPPPSAGRGALDVIREGAARLASAAGRALREFRMLLCRLFSPPEQFRGYEWMWYARLGLAALLLALALVVAKDVLLG